MTTSSRSRHAASWVRYRAPEQPTGVLARARLRSALDGSVDAHRVTVVTAPSGYGKTTAVSEWARHRDADVVWLSLGTFDDDWLHLASGIIEAFRQFAQQRGDDDPLRALLEIDAGSDSKVVFHALGSVVSQSATDVYFVVDDAHRAGETLTSDLMGSLLDAAPERLRIVLIGNSYLELAMSKLALVDPTAFIQSPELAFDRREVSTLVARHASMLDVDNLVDETQGWPIAVRMALLSGRKPPAVSGVADARLLDYVRDHVLASLPDDLSSFIRLATVCGQLTAELATAITGRADAGALLEHIATRGIFLDRTYVGDHATYRWHQVFARQCTRIAMVEDRAGVAAAHERAAAHLAAIDPIASIAHSVTSGGTDRAVITLCRHWVSLLVGDEASTVARVCSGLPASAADDPRVLLIRACAEDIVGERHIARATFARATAMIAASAADAETTTVLKLAHLFLLDDRAELLRSSNDAQALLAVPGVIDGRERAAVLFVLGWTELRIRARPGLVVELLTNAAREAGAASNGALERRALSHLATAFAWAGRNSDARGVLGRLHESSDDSSQPGANDGGGAGARAFAEGFVAFWSADFTRAADAVVQAIEGGSSRVSFVGVARMLLAFTAAASRNEALCRRAAAEIQSMPRSDAHGLNWSVFRDASIAVLEEAAGHRERALAIAKRHTEHSDLPLVSVMMSGVLRRAGDLTSAFHLLRRHQAFIEISYVRVMTELTAALVHRRQGDVTVAHELLERALSSAVEQDLRAPFCDGDLQLRSMLAEHLSHRTCFETFITECLTTTRWESVLDALSARERDVFRLLQTSKTLKEVADDLDVSVNTVKTHQRSIYRKLGVQNRREAQQVAP